MFIQLNAVSVTMTYDSSGNVDLHIPHTLVGHICGMCQTPIQVVYMVVTVAIVTIVTIVTLVTKVFLT